MSAEAVSPITTYFRVCDGVRVRFADTKADSNITVLLLAPWPETLWAFRRIWDRVSAIGRVVAIDLPGRGPRSDERPRGFRATAPAPTSATPSRPLPRARASPKSTRT